jgi:hypothetical protein
VQICRSAPPVSCRRDAATSDRPTCASCGTLLRVGDTAFLDATARRQVWCVDHAPAADDPRWRELALATARGGQLSPLSASRFQRDTRGSG